MPLASEIMTLLDILCKNTDKIYEEFGLELGYYFTTPLLVMDLIFETRDEKIGLITPTDQSLIRLHPGNRAN